MKKYLVHITPNASKMLIQIYEYIAFELLEPIYASEQLLNLQNQICSFDTMPKRCKAFSKTIYPGYELRRMLVDNYSVFYYLDDNTVTVTDIIYSRSDILERLNK